TLELMHSNCIYTELFTGSKNSPMVSTIVSPEVKPANPASIAREESSTNVEPRVIPPPVTSPAEATKQDLSPEIVKKTKVKVKKIIKTKAIKKVSKNTNNAIPNKPEPTAPAKAEAPVVHESKKETATVNSTEEQKSEGLFEKLVKDVQKGAESECTLAQRALNQCN
ncbi:MAG: hypothetical protein PSV17_06455, partial [Methylotenera sp.]|uniref:hypothetical protein n=1 Tax=Methylotenera sp. TaxID=2051956 RepID=UPI0024887484